LAGLLCARLQRPRDCRSAESDKKFPPSNGNGHLSCRQKGSRSSAAEYHGFTPDVWSTCRAGRAVGDAVDDAKRTGDRIDL
jgi:hypothetical protein